MKKKEWKVPFSSDGSLFHYCSAKEENSPGVQWRDSEIVFDAVLHFQGYCRGRSAAYFMFKNKATQATYPMFLTDMEDILKNRIIALGMIGGRWKAVKRGSNYGIKFVG